MFLRFFCSACILPLFLCSSLLAQNGSVAGVVTDAKTGETIIGSTVLIQGTNIGVATDLDGNFHIGNLKPGSYNLSVSFISYNKQLIENVKVERNKTTELQIRLEEAVTAISGVTVTATRQTNTEISMMNTIKTSSLVANGISGQQISRAQDKDAAEAIRRVPGITLQGSRFIIIRGLSERYNTVWLNGAATPSSETDVRAFAFDMIPSSLIENMIVYKTPAPELPGDFAGAAVQIVTRSLPDQRGITLNYGTSYRSGTSFREFYRYQGGKTDWLGFDDGTRALPKGFPDHHLAEIPRTQDGRQLRTDIGRSLNKTWDAEKLNALNDNRFSVNYTGKFRLGKASINNITSLNYSNTYETREVFRANYFAYDTINDAPDTAYYFNEMQYAQSAKTGVLHNWAVVFGENQVIEFRNFFNQSGTTKTIRSEGRDNYGGSYLRSHELDYISRSIYSGQLGGRHKTHSGKSAFDWVLGYSYASKDQPDIRRVTYVLNDDEQSQYYNQYGVNFNFAANSDLNGRIYMAMQENTYTGVLNWQQRIEISNWKPEIKAGVYAEKKDRVFDARLIGYAIARSSQFDWSIPYLSLEEIFADTNINATTGIRLDEQTNDLDSYRANHVMLAGYVGLKLPISSFLNLYAGIRLEQYDFLLRSGSAENPLEVNNDTLNFFPSANLTYTLTENSLLRFAYGMTMNRPEYREIAPFNFYVYDLKAYFKGNTGLKSCYIHNFDVRYEFYPSVFDMFTAGLFLKRFTSPIEATMYAAGSGWNYTFTNADNASALGAEIEWRKSLSGWGKRSDFLRWFKDITCVFNASYIYSQVVLDDPTVYEKVRPMQGQSPYIFNAGVYYDNEKNKFSGALLYNVIGKRIAFIGNATDPHTWEMPRHLIDLTISRKFGKWIHMKASANDLLNQKVLFKKVQKFSRDTNGDGVNDEILKRDEITRMYRPGTYVTVGIGLNF